MKVKKCWECDRGVMKMRRTNRQIDLVEGKTVMVQNAETYKCQMCDVFEVCIPAMSKLLEEVEASEKVKITAVYQKGKWRVL